MRSPVLLAIITLALPAMAQVPEKGDGTISLLAGGRLIVPASNDYLADQGATHQPLTFAGIASFGYQFDDELHFKIELGYLPDRYRLAGGDLTIRTFPLMIALDTVLARGKWWTWYGGGGLGYSLNTGTRNGVNNEANSTAVYLALGFRLRLSEHFALLLEDRYILASAQADPSSSKSINMGGDLFTAGLMFHFFQEQDHPEHP